MEYVLLCVAAPTDSALSLPQNDEQKIGESQQSVRNLPFVILMISSDLVTRPAQAGGRAG